MGIELKETNDVLDNNEQWRNLLREAKYLGITPEEIRSFIKMARTIDLSNWNKNEKDRT